MIICYPPVRQKIVNFNVFDVDLNLSDHLPIIAVCVADVIDNMDCPKPASTEDVTHFRWDHAPLQDYYEQTRLGLQPILAELDELIINKLLYSNDDFVRRIDSIYNCVVSVLQQCSHACVPKHKNNFYKFWWNQELNELKEKAIASCQIWKDAGKPRYGAIHAKYKQDKLLYKKRIRQDRVQETSSFTNELHDALLHKSGRDFWKKWNSKFENK